MLLHCRYTDWGGAGGLVKLHLGKFFAYSTYYYYSTAMGDHNDDHGSRKLFTDAVTHPGTVRKKDSSVVLVAPGV